MVLPEHLADEKQPHWYAHYEPRGMQRLRGINICQQTQRHMKHDLNDGSDSVTMEQTASVAYKGNGREKGESAADCAVETNLQWHMSDACSEKGHGQRKAVLP